MVTLFAWLLVAVSGLAWRLSDGSWSFQVLLLGGAALVIGARSWVTVAPRPRRVVEDPPTGDLEVLRLQQADAYIRERLAAGARIDQIAASSEWFEQGAMRERP